MTEPLTLFDPSDVRGRARRTDPETSRSAARRPRGGLRARILTAYRDASDGLTDDELAARIPDAHPPSVKSARTGLTNDGFLVKTDGRRASNTGHEMIVWRLAVRAVETLPPL